MSENEVMPVVIDNGTGMVKAGIAGDDSPKSVFPSVIGVPTNKSIVGNQEGEIFIGQQAVNKKGQCTLRNPIEHGIVTSWDDMTKIWNHTFYTELRQNPSEAPVLLTEAPKNPKPNREKMTEIMFETFDVPSMYIQIQAVLSLYASGRTTGMVFDCGDGVAHTVPIVEGRAIKPSIMRINLAGRDMTEWMQQLLQKHHGLDLFSSSNKEIAREIKEKLCYVAVDIAKERAKTNVDKEYMLPNGEKVMIGVPRYECPECLFDPQMAGKSDDVIGIHKIIANTIASCDINLRASLYESIVLSGGTTCFEGLPDRLTKEVKALVPPDATVKVISPPERKYSVWIGGSILASLGQFQKEWMTKAEYDETGSSLVHTKCI